VQTISSYLQLGLHGSGMSSSLAAVEEAKLLLAGSAEFGSRFKASASLAGQVATTTHAASSLLFALLHVCPCASLHLSTLRLPLPPLLTAHDSHDSTLCGRCR